MGLLAKATGTAATVARRRLERRGLAGGDRPQDAARWRVVSVNLPPDQVLTGGSAPAPLAAWGDAVEVRVSAAPGDRGSELAARLRDPGSVQPPDGLDGETPVQKLRSALRRSKQLLETGEVLRADEPGTSQPTATNAPLREMTGQSGGGGRL